MSEDEVLISILGLVLGVASAITLSASRLHGVYTQANPGIGLHRAVVAATLAWTLYVIEFHGDPSITGVYVAFYLLLAYAAVKFFGQLVGPLILGLSVRRDVFVGRNGPIALVSAAFAAATGAIFGACLWGEADPLSEDEGGWWIPIGFFLLGWTLLVTSAALYAWRGRRLGRWLRREHDPSAARTAAVFCLSTGALILQGVAGDFWGWAEGLLSMGTIALMLLGHEFLSARFGDGPAPTDRGPMTARELLQHALFLGLALSCWGLNTLIARHFVGPAAGG